MEGDEVRLRLPGEPAYGRLARIAASNLARRLGFTFREIEDLGLAVDETVILLLQPSGGRVDGIEVTLQVTHGSIDLCATALPRPDPAAVVEPLSDPVRQRFEALVDGTVTSWEVDEAGRQVHLVVQQR